MQKISLDFYNCHNGFMDKPYELYNICNLLLKHIHFESMYAPTVIPYFDGKNKLDEGVSCFLHLKNAHGLIGYITLHTFSQRNSMYFDLVLFDKKQKLKSLQNTVLTFLVHTFNPGQVDFPLEKSNKKTWGIETLFEIDCNKQQNIDDLYNINLTLLKKINMTQIHETVCNKNEKSGIITLLTIISESHISLVYNEKKCKLFVDVFSCKYFDYNILLKVFSGLGFSVCSTKVNYRGLRHCDKELSQISFEEVLKIKSYLLCYGLAVNKDIYPFISKQKPHINDKGFVHAFNLNLYGHNICVSTAEKFSSSSQFILNYSETRNQFYISNNKYPYLPIHIFDDLPKTNSIIDKIAKPHSLTCISMWPSLKCCFAQNNDQKCKFCSILNDEYDIIPAEEVVSGVKKLFKETYEYSLNIGGGTYKNPDEMIKYLISIIKGIRTFSNTAISCEVAPPKKLSLLKDLKDAGCSSLIVNLEIANDSLRKEICPAKHNISYEHYYETYKKGIELFGKGKVSCVLIVGIQKNEDIIKECEKLVSIGVVPTLIPFKAMDNCNLNNNKNCNPKDLTYCAKHLAKILNRAKLSPCNQLGCTKCGGCSLEVDYAKFLKNY